MDIPTEEQARFLMEKAMRIHRKIEPKKLEKEKYYFVIPVFNARYIGTVSDETNKMKRLWQYTYGDFEKVNDKVNIDGASAYFEIPEKFLKIEPPGFTSEDTSYQQSRLVPKMSLGEASIKSNPVQYNSDSNSNNNSGPARTASFRNKKNRKNRKSRKTRRYQRG